MALRCLLRIYFDTGEFSATHVLSHHTASSTTSVTTNIQKHLPQGFCHFNLYIKRINQYPKLEVPTILWSFMHHKIGALLIYVMNKRYHIIKIYTYY